MNVLRYDLCFVLFFFSFKMCQKLTDFIYFLLYKKQNKTKTNMAKVY